jgi:murein DD-endopeptidase MepM/ murein hydrolase activator NlpD
MAKTLRGNRINKIMYVSLGGVAVAVILFIILFNYFNNNHKENNLDVGENNSQNTEIEEANSSLGKTVDELQNSENVEVKVDDGTQANEQLSQELNEIEEIPELTVANSNDNPDVSNSTSEINSVNVSNSEDKEQKEEVKDPNFTMPVEGEIIKHYGKEKLIYSDTLKEWTTHLGIDIKADKTTVVKAAADGTVKSIKNDPRYGLTVVLEHQNGFTSVYSNLLTAEFVVQGETVKMGQTLGTVGNSATFEILDDSHLHFEILKDGNSIDPEMYIK